MPAEHPALFDATGYAHHPYQLLTAPKVTPRDRDYVTIGVLGRLTRTLDGIFRSYGVGRRLNLYLTEYGYQTYPDLFGVTFGRQAAYLNQSEHIAWRNPRVKTMAQFLLDDDGSPIPLTFQSGLRTNDGKPKPSLAAYRLPVDVTGRGRRRSVWALVRPAAVSERPTVEIQYRRPKAKRWRRLRTATTSGPRNGVRATVKVPRGRGRLRVVSGPMRSRTVACADVAPQRQAAHAGGILGGDQGHGPLELVEQVDRPARMVRVGAPRLAEGRVEVARRQRLGELERHVGGRGTVADDVGAA